LRLRSARASPDSSFRNSAIGLASYSLRELRHPARHWHGCCSRKPSRRNIPTSAFSDYADPIWTGQSSTHGRCLLDRPVKPGDDSELCANLNEKRSSWGRFRGSNHIDIIRQPRPVERALARVSKDGHRRGRAGGHPSRRAPRGADISPNCERARRENRRSLWNLRRVTPHSVQAMCSAGMAEPRWRFRLAPTIRTGKGDRP
jgi:hypothetical protein